MLGVSLALLLQAPTPAPPPKVVAGEIAGPVACASNPKLTYALYLPTRFTADRPWPILYIFDPRGRGKLAAELFKDVAERRGFILASSNDTESDNPNAPNAAVVNALWSDTHQRLPIDPKRVYATGFSGGSRLAFSLGVALNGGLAGVVAVGGGFPPDRPPMKGLPFAVFGIVGTRDFNYYEMRELDATLEKLGATHRLEVWEGEHDWPPPELAGEALEWMDLVAMKKGLLPRDEAMIEGFDTRESQRAATLEARDRKLEALSVYEATARDLDGLRDVGPLRAAVDRLRKAGLDDERKRREKLDKRDVAVNNKNSGILETLRSGEEPPPVGRVLTDLDVSGLLKAAQQDSYDGQSAQRRLAHVLVQAAFYLPREMMERGEYRRAAAFYQIAAAIRPESPRVPFNLARALARLGSKRDALDALARAVENGLDDRAAVESDPDLASIRADPAYQALLDRIPRQRTP